jgi:hypothetical protein
MDSVRHCDIYNLQILPTLRFEGDIKICLSEMESVGMDRWRAVVITVMNLLPP